MVTFEEPHAKEFVDSKARWSFHARKVSGHDVADMHGSKYADVHPGRSWASDWKQHLLEITSRLKEMGGCEGAAGDKRHQTKDLGGCAGAAGDKRHRLKDLRGCGGAAGDQSVEEQPTVVCTRADDSVNPPSCVQEDKALQDEYVDKARAHEEGVSSKE